jgi:hypothetical protein
VNVLKAAPSIALTEEGEALEQVAFVGANWIECRTLLPNL